MQHVDGEAKGALQIFFANKGGYIMVLKRIKYLVKDLKLTRRTLQNWQGTIQYQMMMINHC